jgi:hypothetical protein
MFSLTNRINRFHHVYHQVVTIKNKLCVIIRDIVTNRRIVWITDIGHNGFNPLKRFLSAAAEISIKALFFPILSNVYDRTFGQIAHNGYKIMSTANGLFVYPYLFRSTFSLFQSSSNSFLYDAPGLIPTNTKQSRSAHDVTGFQDLISEPFKKNRKPRIRLSPRKMKLHYSMSRTLDSRCSFMQIRHKLATIKVTPYSLGRMIINGKLLLTFRTVKARIFTVGNKYISSLLGNIEFNLFYEPRYYKPQRVAVQFFVFHGSTPFWSQYTKLFIIHKNVG